MDKLPKDAVTRDIPVKNYQDVVDFVSKEFEEVLGYFLNPVVLRAQVRPDESFVTFLEQVRQTLIDGIGGHLEDRP